METLTPKLITTLSVCVVVALFMAAPVSAFYFQVYYFETDKMSYEVGESIDMVAKLIADFAEGGWCYVSFAVITDSGPVFNEGYFISSSPDIRFLTSSYVITPDETTPGVNGTHARVIFNYDIYDEYSQSGSQVVDVDLKRGPLIVLPLTPLSVQFGDNTTLMLRIASAHDNNIPFANQGILLSIRDPDLQLILDTNTTTDSLGQISMDWTQAMGSPGNYNMTLTSPGSPSFLPFSESLTIIVEPGPSTLTVLTTPNRVYCEFPDYGEAELLEITTMHLNSSLLPINDSIVEWSTSFSNGSMTNLGNGHYGATIPFFARPGLYLVNLTATNRLYRIAVTTVSVDCLPRPISSSITMPPDSLCGSTIPIEVRVTDVLTGAAVPSLPATISISIGNSTLARYQGTTNSSGCFSVAVYLPKTIWGTSCVLLKINGTLYHDSLVSTLVSRVSFAPNVFFQPVASTVLGKEAGIRVHITDPNGNPVAYAIAELRSPDNTTTASNSTNSEGNAFLYWLVPEGSEFGNQTYWLLIHSSTSLFIHQMVIPIEFTVLCPLQFLCPNSEYSVMRNSNVTISFMIESGGPESQTIEIGFRDNLAQILSDCIIRTETNVTIGLSIGSQVSVGRHILTLEVVTGPYLFVGAAYIEIVVKGSIRSNSRVVSAFYGESLVLNITASDDINDTVDIVSVRVFFIDTGLQVCLSNITTYQLLSIALPLCLAPGPHVLGLQIRQLWLGTANESISVFVWMRTSITISIHKSYTHDPNGGNHNQVSVNALTSSSGSIISPPPILFNGNTSAELPTARETSLTICPRFSSGTSNFSTVPANSLTSVSGNGHIVFSLRDRSEIDPCFSIMTSSTVLEVHPKETTPHSAFCGPETTTSVRRSLFLRIFNASLRINLS